MFVTELDSSMLSAHCLSNFKTFSVLRIKRCFVYECIIKLSVDPPLPQNMNYLWTIVYYDYCT